MPARTSSATNNAAPAAAASPDPLPVYGAKARVAAEPPPAPSNHVAEADAQRIQEHLGPSFSLAESLPGTLPVFSGVPFLIVRGAPPSGTRSLYDGVPVPALFHMALGPSIVDTHLLGGMQFYPGVAPARYAGHLGGALSADAATLSPTQGTQRELQLSLLDASGYLQVPSGNGTLAAAWRIGDPGLIMNAINLDATLSYFDYSLRYDQQLGTDDHLELLSFGAGDQLGDRTAPEDDIGLQFHRALVRYTRRLAHTTIGAQLWVGYDASTLGQELNGSALRVSPDLYVETRIGSARLRVGAQLSAAQVRLRGHGGATNSIDLGGNRGADGALDPEDFVDNAPLASVPSRDDLGVYAELHLSPLAALDLDLGLRGDLWLAGNTQSGTADPSALVTYHAPARIDLHAGVALMHMPRSSPLPIPGLDDLAFDAGTQSALQTEVGAQIRIGDDTRASATFFYNHFYDTVYLELILDCEGHTDPQAAQALFLGRRDTSICRKARLPTASGDAYGLELYLERNFARRLSGFLSYTLAFAGAEANDGTEFTPQADVRHIANAVLQYDFGAGFSAGARLHARTGKMAVNTILDLTQPTASFTRVEHRLPGFFRADLHVTYAFETGFAHMQATLSWLNLTFSREVTSRDCFFNQQLAVECRLNYQPAIVLPNVSLRAQM